MQDIWNNLEVDVSALPAIEEVHFQKHPIRYRAYRYTLSTIWLGIPVLLISALALLLAEWWLWMLAGAFFFLFGFSLIAISIGYHKRCYALRQKDFSYREGWLFSSMTTVPFNRIQHTEVSQGPLERKYGLSRLHIYTAGGSSSDLSVPGLESEEAAQLRDYVARKASQYA